MHLPLEPNASLLHYRLIEQIGQGGMGVVWSAEDTRLGRRVAVKLLAPDLTADADRLARFDREARLLASLNHPNIGALYAIEEAEGERFLVLELIPGETLAERIERGALPIEEALGVARQIAAALAAAHAAGVLHRDLKPANVKVTPEGKVKVLDFGLAKGFQSSEMSPSSPSMSPTLTSLGTRAGVILGTASYMSPEQARGRNVDRRADVWGLGCVLYEMLTGRRPFAGETVSDTLASVLKEDPDWTALPAGLPPAAQRVLRRMLAKDPGRRVHDVADAILDLDEGAGELAAGPVASAVAPAPRRRVLLPWVLLAVACAAAAWSARLALRAEPISSPVTASILAPLGSRFDLDRGLALSPDGSRLVSVVRGEDGVRRLWLRALDRGTGQILAGTDGARNPFWSPDGRRIGFATDKSLRWIEVDSGVVESLASSLTRPGGGSWGAGGEILISSGGGDTPILLIPASGGEPVPATQPGKAHAHHWPYFLPDGRHFLFLERDYGGGKPLGEIHVGSLDGVPSRKLVSANSNAVYVAPGFLVWWHEGNLRAQRFDADRLALDGEPFVLAAGARFDPRSGYAAFTLSSGGILAFQEQAGKAGNELVWLDREGRELGVLAGLASYYVPRLSPDGSRVATDISDETNRGDIWLLDSARGTPTRFTSWPEDDTAPVWSPDGEQIAFVSTRGEGSSQIYTRPVRGTAEPQSLIQNPEADVTPLDWSRDGFLLLERGSNNAADLWAYSAHDGTSRPYLAGPFAEVAGAFSPDGRLVAFTSNETDRPEIYVATFPTAGERWRVSTDGGAQAVWRRDGGELYYAAPDGQIMAVTVGRSGDARPVLGTPRALFRVDLKEHRSANFATIDGQRFLVNRNVDTGATSPLTLVLQPFARAGR